MIQNNINMNKKIFCEKCHKWHTITITEEDKFAICPNKRCGHLIFI
ncbi:hypothetical protein BACCELL_00409 [Bacteroides cellulosilyticus DSM 14838]|uniref:Uncharacterized protein n=1 Tax=Bacteroides cellulosilyticus DSM 14838 TaxID=537012 RepID=E2N814_9BACE|nr:hypothetical protein BACCELL_00409 [Bacteroides cellulosilyticus DSM 14838]